MNWGKRIAFTYIGFVIFMVTLAYIASKQNFDLVSEDYYEQELSYQKKIDAAANFNAETHKVEFGLNDSALSILFPLVTDTKKLKGEIHCYKAADASSDFTLPIAVDASGKQTISRNKFNEGLFIIKLSYSVNDKPFYVEKEIKF
jgi:hypothetical protein